MVKAKTKKTEKKEVKKEVKKEIEKTKEKDKYLEAIGKRKTAVARVRIFTHGERAFLVNQKPLEKYFSIVDLQRTAQSSLDKMKCLDKFRVETLVKGGGLSSQAEAIRHGTARALTLFNLDFKKRLRRAGFLTRDSRIRERKKFGLKRARRAPQWQKR